MQDNNERQSSNYCINCAYAYAASGEENLLKVPSLHIKCKQAPNLTGRNLVDGSNVGSALQASAMLTRLDDKMCGRLGHWFLKKPERLKQADSGLKELMLKRLASITGKDL